MLSTYREFKEQCSDVLTVMCFFEERLKKELCVIFARLKFMTGETKLIYVKAWGSVTSGSKKKYEKESTNERKLLWGTLISIYYFTLGGGSPSLSSRSKSSIELGLSILCSSDWRWSLSWSNEHGLRKKGSDDASVLLLLHPTAASLPVDKVGRVRRTTKFKLTDKSVLT